MFSTENVTSNTTISVLILPLRSQIMYLDEDGPVSIVRFFLIPYEIYCSFTSFLSGGLLVILVRWNKWTNCLALLATF